MEESRCPSYALNTLSPTSRDGSRRSTAIRLAGSGRERSGVRRYAILRPVGDPNYVLIDLEFDTKSEAEALLAAMREVWRRVEGQVMSNPQVRIIETVETKEY